MTAAIYKTETIKSTGCFVTSVQVTVLYSQDIDISVVSQLKPNLSWPLTSNSIRWCKNVHQWSSNWDVHLQGDFGGVHAHLVLRPPVSESSTCIGI